jgi:hypothetical protein
LIHINLYGWHQIIEGKKYIAILMVTFLDFLILGILELYAELFQ